MQGFNHEIARDLEDIKFDLCMITGKIQTRFQSLKFMQLKFFYPKQRLLDSCLAPLFANSRKLEEMSKIVLGNFTRNAGACKHSQDLALPTRKIRKI